MWPEVGPPSHQLLQEGTQVNKDIKTGRALFIVSSANITTRAVISGTEEHHRYEHCHSNHPWHCYLKREHYSMSNSYSYMYIKGTSLDESKGRTSSEILLPDRNAHLRQERKCPSRRAKETSQSTCGLSSLGRSRHPPLWLRIFLLILLQKRLIKCLLN